MYNINRNRFIALKNILAIACIVLLIGNAQCGSLNVEFKNHPELAPHFNQTDQIVLNWSVLLPESYKSYSLSVVRPIQENGHTINISDGPLTPPLPTTGSKDISGREAGHYNVSLTVNPGDSKVILSSFDVKGPTNIQIIKFEDTNGNGKQDPGENGLPGWNFWVGKDGATPSLYQIGTGKDGILFITNPGEGKFEIDEENQPGWYSTNGSVQQVSVTEENTTTVKF